MTTGGTNTGGTNTGGVTTTGGAGGTGGIKIPGMSDKPNPVIYADCMTQCEAPGAKSCPNDKPGDCANGCTTFASFPACETQSNAALACVKTATPSCTTDGKTEYLACKVLGDALFNCILPSSSDPQVNADCTASCERHQAAHCSADSALADCIRNCSAGDILPACHSEYAALVSCEAKETYTCGSDNKSSAGTTCSTTAMAWFTCYVMQPSTAQK